MSRADVTWTFVLPEKVVVVKVPLANGLMTIPGPLTVTVIVRPELGVLKPLGACLDSDLRGAVLAPSRRGPTT